MKRLAIYFIYDKDGIVDRYIGTVLANLIENVEHLTVVSNGALTNNSKIFLKNYTNDILIRENKGFDVWAYKAAMDKIGWKNLETYDELVLLNYTIMGPVYPLSDVFETMEKRQDLDFWGITKCFEETSPEAQKIWDNPYGYIPEHIQSSFTVFRKNIIRSKIFQDYWNNMPPILSYYESGGKHEQVITKYFSDNGFKWDCYTNYDDIDKEYYTCCPLINFPLDIVKEKKSPFFKRRSFFTTKKESSLALPKAKELLSFLENETNYDVSMIYENLIRTCNQRDLAEAFILSFIEETLPSAQFSPQKRIAIFINTQNIIDKDSFILHLKFFKNIADIYINDKNDFKQSYSNFCTGVNSTFQDYDYILVINPFKKEINEDPAIYNVRQKYYLYNFLKSSESLKRALSVLESNPYIGLLTTPIDFMKAYHWESYEKWADLYYSISRWKKDNEINVLTNFDKSPIRTENGVFLIKKEAVLGLDLLKFDNYSSEFLSYVIPVIAQANKYLPGYFISSELIIHNSFGYETYADWIFDLRKIKNKYYEERKEYIDLCESNLEKQYQYIQNCERNLTQQQQYIQNCERNLAQQQQYIQNCESRIKQQQNYISQIFESTSWKSTKVLRLLGKLIKKINN